MALRSDILAGRLLPGEQLKFHTLVAAHDASIPVIREALTHLVERGLVESEVNHGYRVKQHSREDLVDLTQSRQFVEPAVFEDSVRHGSPQWEANLVGAHHLLSQTPLFDPADPDRMNDQWAIAHASFHTALLAGARSHRLQAFALQLRDEAELLRQRSAVVPATRDRDLAGEHLELRDLAVSRQPEAAAAALRTHILRTAELVSRAEDGWLSDE